ncbi:MAG: hypothetical protein AUJ39_00540 [Parcubacteria group bacterium CG1_02_42_13]|nr:MAG: hypothetical protein AUJ39_00540 [Parcubacteria group bacterium CG1_02_42_13]
MTKVNCGKKLGSYEDEICYKEQGHDGKCYKSLGHEAEDLIQMLLADCGCFVAKGTIHEDHKLKIDFWVFAQEAKKINGGDEYLPIQFTIDKNAACGTKGRDAIRNGIIIICIEVKELLEWKHSEDSSLRDVVRWRIYREFWDMAEKIVKAFPYINLTKPKCQLARFKEIVKEVA